MFVGPTILTAKLPETTIWTKKTSTRSTKQHQTQHSNQKHKQQKLQHRQKKIATANFLGCVKLKST